MYVLKKNTNEKSDNFGRWFAQVKSLETLGLRKMADHIAEHGSLYTSDVVFGVLEKFRKCCIEQLLNSRKVKIEGLGTFYTTSSTPPARTRRAEQNRRRSSSRRTSRHCTSGSCPNRPPRWTFRAGSSSSAPSSSTPTPGSTARRRKRRSLSPK